MHSLLFIVVLFIYVSNKGIKNEKNVEAVNSVMGLGKYEETFIAKIKK